MQPDTIKPYSNPFREPETPKPRFRGMAMSVEDMADELAIGRNVAYQLVQQPDVMYFILFLWLLVYCLLLFPQLDVNRL